MKFTLLEPCDEKFYHSEVSGPLGLAYIASYIDKELDNSINTSIETDVEYVLKTKPDIVGISAYTQNFSRALAAAKKIKEELNIPIILGGKHITVLPETLQQYFDVGVIGDGERTMSDLMKLYVEKKLF
ncbi:MAG: cobalamin-dependent protein, partial [Candidatus Sericytochromatia bacterium]